MEAVIKLFLDNLEVLATHPSQYGETKVLQIKIDLIPGNSVTILNSTLPCLAGMKCFHAFISQPN